MVKGISVVIPNYNGLSLFSHTLPTVFTALELIGLPNEVIVVDDASTDDSVNWLRSNYPQLRILSNEKNSGFSVTANKGIFAAQHNHVLLLNSDVKLEPGYFKPLLSYFDRPGTFGVMGRIVGWDDEIIQDAAKFPSFHGVKIKTYGNYLLVDEEEMKNGLYSMYLSGANAFISKSVFEEIGGFNELFSPFYVEDYELSLRAWRMGYKCYYEHAAVCRHKLSASINAKSRKRYIQKVYDRNKMFLNAIHLNKWQRSFYFLQLVPEVMARFFSARWSYLSSVYLLLENFADVNQSRNAFLGRSGNRKLFSVREVADTILNSIKGKRITRF